MDVSRGHGLPKLETDALTRPGSSAPGLVSTVSCLCGCLGRCHWKRPNAMYTTNLVSARVLRQPTALDRGEELLHYGARGPRNDL